MFYVLKIGVYLLLNRVFEDVDYLLQNLAISPYLAGSIHIVSCALFSEKQINLIKGASGKTGQAGKQYTTVLRDAGIKVTWEQAQKIFETLTWPKFTRLAEKAFPGLDKLCDDAYGAIVSLVFNRGTSMSGESRSEMREIRSLVPKKDYRSIALEIQKMKRIWKGKGLDGLLTRRDAESALVLKCLN